MKCIICDIDETKARYMLKKNNEIGVCDTCVINMSKILSEELKQDTKDMLENLKSK